MLITEDGLLRDLGYLRSDGAIGSLFAEVHKPETVRLQQGQVTIATAKLAY